MRKLVKSYFHRWVVGCCIVLDTLHLQEVYFLELDWCTPEVLSYKLLKTLDMQEVIFVAGWIGLSMERIECFSHAKGIFEAGILDSLVI